MRQGASDHRPHASCPFALALPAPRAPHRWANGAGKTTFAHELLPALGGVRFLNADAIAAGLSPGAPDRAAVRAGRVLLGQLVETVEQRESFAVETTLSGRLYEQLVPAWQATGYRVTLFFLRLSDEETAIERVAERVRQGGYDVLEPAIRCRYHAGLRKLP